MNYLKQTLLWSILCLVAVFAACQKEEPQPEKPFADFDIKERDSISSLQIVLTNKSKNAATFIWDFGDGRGSTEKEPKHTYKSGGVYAISLTIKGEGGTDRIVKTIGIATKPLARFTFKTCDSLAVAPCEVRFTDMSSYATTLFWDFGDGTNSTETNPKHEYTKAGIYEVMLTARGIEGIDRLTRTVRIFAPLAAAVADFDVNNNNCPAPCKVTFNNKSKNATQYFWDFGDGTSSVEPNPVKSYTKGGTYTARLTAKNAAGLDVLSRTINIENPPLADFEIVGGNCKAGCEVSFINRSTFADTFVWDFGNGKSSDERSPRVRYDSAGTYNIRLIAIGKGGTNILARTVTIVR